MRKSLKWLGAIVCILVLLVVLTVVCLVTFVNPNRFKPLIAEQVMKYTGRQLTIEGDLSWSLIPYLGVKTGHVLLSNPAGFEQKIFAEVQHATFGVKLLPLFDKRIESSGILLDGLKLNLIKDANGKNNWQFQQPLVNTSQPLMADRSRSNQMRRMRAGLAIEGVEVTNAEINWTDKQKNQFLTIEKLNLQAKDISLLKPFSISSDFNFTNKNPDLSGHVKMTSDTSFNVEQQIFSLRNLVLDEQLQQGTKKYNWQVKGDVIADLQQQTVQWTNFQGQLGNLNLTGKISIVNLTTTPHVAGHFQIQPCDLKEVLKSMGQDMANVQTLKNMSGIIDFTAAANVLDVQGKFKIDTVEAKQVKLSNVMIPMHYQIGVLELAPITADFYQGSLQSTVKVNLTGAVPQIAMDSKFTNVHMEPLLEDLGGSNHKLKLQGVGNIALQTTTLGNSADALMKNLNGTGQVTFNQGVLQGIDIGFLIDSAYSVLKQQALTTPNTKKTLFDSLTGNLVFRDGVMVNDDLVLTAPRFKTNGKGSIDLVNQKIDFHLQTVLSQATVEQKNNWGNLYGLPIPINIAGNLKDPVIRLDTGALVKVVADQQIKKIESKVQDQLKDKVQGKASEMLKSLLGR